jgi:hypothetical protein
VVKRPLHSRDGETAEVSQRDDEREKETLFFSYFLCETSAFSASLG